MNPIDTQQTPELRPEIPHPPEVSHEGGAQEVSGSVKTQKAPELIASAPEKTAPAKAGRGGPGLWLDRLRCRITVGKWQRRQRKQEKRRQKKQRLKNDPRAAFLGDALYMIGFWAEYGAVCVCRTAMRFCRAVLLRFAQLALAVLRPVLLALITLCEDLAEPFIRAASGLRHIRALPQAHPTGDADELRRQRKEYLKSGIIKYYPLVVNALAYLLPVGAAALLVLTIQNALDKRYILEVQVNGQSVGYVANEQVFESAKEDVQSRINSAKAAMQSNGAQVDTGRWEISPTYVLATEGTPMTENDMTDAILRASSDEISDATAVYIDGSLSYVTTEGDHLRSFLEHIRAPYVDAMDSSKRVEFLHDIELVDGVYFNSSISSYDSIISSLNAGARPATYTAAEGDDVISILQQTNLSFEKLQELNPQIEDGNYPVSEGEEFVVAAASSPLLQVKTVVRSTVEEEVPYDKVTLESSEYDYGKMVLAQEGVTGLEQKTYDVTYINGIATDVSIVQIVRLSDPVNEVTYKGTKLRAGLYASTGTGNWVWPVPQYTYVSRWMGSGHNGADICAPYGVDVIASDSGVVEIAGSHWSYGNYVVIDHGNGWRTLYGHMSQLYVTAGQPIERGKPIGAIGSTGNSTGNHCHFEMYQNGSLVSAHNFFNNM